MEREKNCCIQRLWYIIYYL